MKRFWSKVEKTEGGCWTWIASSTRSGYGHIKIDGRHRQAHRVAYELVVGPVPDGLVLDHLCRNRACVNPVHLEPVTERENILRGQSFSAVNAAKTECARGHVLDAANTYARPDGARGCRACNRLAVQRYRQRSKEAA